MFQAVARAISGSRIETFFQRTVTRTHAVPPLHLMHLSAEARTCKQLLFTVDSLLQTIRYFLILVVLPYIILVTGTRIENDALRKNDGYWFPAFVQKTYWG
jgi:hypothetical protein